MKLKFKEDPKEWRKQALLAAFGVALVSSIYAFAIGRGLCADNPARGVKKAPVRKVERFLSEAEIARLAEALDAEAQQSGNPYPSAAIKLLRDSHGNPHIGPAIKFRSEPAEPSFELPPYGSEQPRWK